MSQDDSKVSTYATGHPGLVMSFSRDSIYDSISYIIDYKYIMHICSFVIIYYYLCTPYNLFVYVCIEHLRNSLNLVARELKKLSKLRQLDTDAYAASINQKKQATRVAKRKVVTNPVTVEDALLAEQQAHKNSNRSHKRKISRMARQIKRLRKENRTIKTENRRLKMTISQLKEGKHDIVLEGDVQTDVEEVFNECCKTKILQDVLTKQDDDNGTLQAFWQEQVERTKCEKKRKKWNPVVLRFMLDLWEKMGEKNFRVLGTEKVSCVGVGVGVSVY